MMMAKGHNLRSAIANLPPVESLGNSQVEEEWLKHEDRLRQLLVKKDPQGFLGWDVLVWTMFVRNQAYVDSELAYLRKRADWKSRWRQAVTECCVGSPMPYRSFPQSSGNLIHHGYHLAQFEERAVKRIADFDFIFEFGGGYGCMCRLAHNLGFRGEYVLFDLPAFSLLQEFFLKSIGLFDHRLHCVSELEQLGRLLPSNGEMGNSLFIATWSISEVPINMRETILGLVSSFNAFLIAYQERFAQVDNVAFFRKWRDTQQGIKWFDWEIDDVPGNHYLVGVADEATG